MPWSAANIPPQTGRTAVVTGASGVLGGRIASVLAGHGATLIGASRGGGVRVDLASPASVRAAAAEIRARAPRVDLLILNAAVMNVPHALNDDGHERTFATNHLGHFALAGLLIDRMLDRAGSRVVVVSSNAHRRGRLDLDPADRSPAHAYDRSKLANLLFAFELQRRLAAAGAATIAIAAHPGNVSTGLWRTSSRLERGLISPRLRPANAWLAQDAGRGALPILRAATDPDVRGGEYYGPGGPLGFTGDPVPVEPAPIARDPDAQRRLWELSERLTGISFPFPAAVR